MLHTKDLQEESSRTGRANIIALEPDSEDALSPVPPAGHSWPEPNAADKAEEGAVRFTVMWQPEAEPPSKLQEGFEGIKAY